MAATHWSTGGCLHYGNVEDCGELCEELPDIRIPRRVDDRRTD